MGNRVLGRGACIYVVACATARALATGPDVVVVNLFPPIEATGELKHTGSQGGISGFAIGTVSCNVGTQPANWFSQTNQHPVIAQNMYRLKDGRFEQIGLAWVKHGFFATMGLDCGTSCQDPGGPAGTRLGVGCSDPYNAQLNSDPPGMGPRSQVNAFTGEFLFPFSAATCTSGDPLCRRLQVHESDIEPAMNPGAAYFIEAHYITPDDATSGNGFNNAAHREMVSEGFAAGGRFLMKVTGPTLEQLPAIRAWKRRDPDVVETDILLPGEGLFILAAKATDLGTGYWAYEYALFNLNSHRSARSFTVPLTDAAIVSDIGFHDVDHHSGEPYDGADWPCVHDTGNDVVTWSTVSYATNVNANALRWSTLYNFRFVTNAEPEPTTVTVGLFRPGPYPDITASTIGPKRGLIDCNRNTIADACDLACEPECGGPCAVSDDCNSNAVPDECERDCNASGEPDTCDVDPADPDGDGFVSPDCNQNLVPDECEADCDGDGVPDDCDGDFNADTDNDHITDCFDLCPTTNPLGFCTCPPVGDCCFPPEFGGFCYSDFGQCCVSPEECLGAGGTPECVPTAVCRGGCLIGDADDDGRLSLRDFATLLGCFSGPVGGPGYQPPSAECARLFDYNTDAGVDLVDHAAFRGIYTGP